MANLKGTTGGASRSLWWLHPRAAALYLGIPLLVVAYLIPENSYLVLYGSRSYVDFDFLLLGLLIYAAFVAGSFFFARTGSGSQEGEAVAYCRWVVWPLFLMTLFGYVVWYAAAALNAGGPGALLNALVGKVVRPEVGGVSVKQDLFETIEGVTTFTQFGILYATVEALLWVYGGAPRKTALLRFAPLLAFSLVRALLVSERLALVEFIVPVVVVLFSLARLPRVGRVVVRFAPLFGVLAVFVLFAVGEYFRSWTYYQNAYDGPYLRFAAERLLGYYATAVNNAAVYFYHGQSSPLQATLSGLFNLPILGGVASAVHGWFFEARGVPHKELLSTYANPEFNNVPLLGGLLGDFSIYFAPLIAFLFGAISFSLYRGFAEGRLVGLLLYPSWFIGLLEMSRIYYWPAGRYLPVLAFVVGTLILFELSKVPDRRLSVGTRRPRDSKHATSLRPAGAGGLPSNGGTGP